MSNQKDSICVHVSPHVRAHSGLHVLSCDILGSDESVCQQTDNSKLRPPLLKLAESLSDTINNLKFRQIGKADPPSAA